MYSILQLGATAANTVIAPNTPTKRAARSSHPTIANMTRRSATSKNTSEISALCLAPTTFQAHIVLDDRDALTH